MVNKTVPQAIGMCCAGMLLASGIQAANFTPLGDLPGSEFFSIAYGVSDNGSVVVGQSISGSGAEGFRWSSGGGMVGLGDLPGGSFSGTALAVSGDGNVVVGGSSGASGQEAFRRLVGDYP